MEIEQTPLRTAIMRIMSDLLDSADESGIYETGRFMDRIEQLLCDMMVAPEVMKLTGSEAVMGFLAWLTTRDETTVLGPSEVVDISLYERFVEANHLKAPREAYHELLVHPEPLPPESLDFDVGEPDDEPLAVLLDSEGRFVASGSFDEISSLLFLGGITFSEKL